MRCISGGDDVTNQRRFRDVFDQAALFFNLTSISTVQTPAVPPVHVRKRVGSDVMTINVNIITITAGI